GVSRGGRVGCRVALVGAASRARPRGGRARRAGARTASGDLTVRGHRRLPRTGRAQASSPPRHLAWYDDPRRGARRADSHRPGHAMTNAIHETLSALDARIERSLEGPLSLDPRPR